MRSGRTMTARYGNLNRWLVGGGGGTVSASPMTAVQANGWKATYPSPPTTIALTDNINLSVTRAGWTASGTPTTVTDTVPVMARLRQPVPNENSLTATDVVLGNFVMAGDVLPAGVTNNSTRVYCPPICYWGVGDHFPIPDTTFTVDLFVAHSHARNGRPVAAVKIIASDGTNTREVLVNSLTWNSWAATGLGADSFRATFTSADFLSAPTAITIDAIVYPWCGPSYQLSTQGNAAPHMNNTVVRGYRVTPMYAYVSASGNDTTGVADTNPATAAASPCLTIAGAATKIRTANNASFSRDEVGGGVIRFPVGTWTVPDTGTGNSTTHPISTACLVYESILPGDKTTTILADNAVTKSAANLCARAIVRNLTLRQTAASPANIFRQSENTNASLTFQNCDFDRNGQTSYALWINRMARVWCIDSKETAGSMQLFQISGATLKNAVVIGSNLVSGNGIIARIAMRTTIVNISPTAAVSLTFARGLIMNSVVSGNNGSGFQVTIVGDFLLTQGVGFAMVGNIFETYGGSGGTVTAWADNNGDEVHDFIFMGNTLPGASDETRFNRLYNDVLAATVPKDMFFRFNVVGRSASKTDVFTYTTTSSNPLAANCVGNWPVVMGVEHACNSLVEGEAVTGGPGFYGPGSWRMEVRYPGVQIGNGIGGALAPQWTADASFTGTGLGGGDYRPNVASPLRKIPAGQTWTARTLRGATIPTDGTAFVGAEQA